MKIDAWLCHFVIFGQLTQASESHQKPHLSIHRSTNDNKSCKDIVYYYINGQVPKLTVDLVCVYLFVAPFTGFLRIRVKYPKITKLHQPRTFFQNFKVTDLFF
jgi:hypothetical protein